MNIEEALLKHMDWKARFIRAVLEQEHMNELIIGRDDCCELGQWLQNEGKRKYSSLASYKTCINKHTAFHVEAQKLVSAINERRDAEANAMLKSNSNLSIAIVEVFIAFVRLKQEAGERNNEECELIFSKSGVFF
ncbi:MAG: chemotaxis protein [Methylobacter sp.]|nr:MAG: chemotaxis protein [Methylobacter sp.]